ncbi:hypothetical protein LOTGIDRAFT_239189 [Lottia gigantea]|uniref:Polysaccharide lyase 14 domain-containing protein n=1 Tax=Lottia gigantea TaxID=225164 RepID=V4ATP1_LOTGI|nr:hypothetical protein LOTGIDRAFT_239189 [Lottia gigantea]ESO97121.1 hypothetical protein LOTGIDRAFT_239189 [Lottia gigantea]
MTGIFLKIIGLYVLCIALHVIPVQTRDTLWQKTTFNSNNVHDGFKALDEKQFNEGSLSVANDPTGGSRDVVKVFIKKGSYVKIKDKRGAQFYTDVGSKDTMTLSYQVYFQTGMDFVRGGKLPGLYGGDPGCSGGRQSVNCLSTRFMWRSNGDGEVYAYIPRNQDANFCNSNDVYCNPDYGTSIGRGSWRFRTGRWERIVQRIKLNRPGKKNGRILVWFNGKKVVDKRNVILRENSSVKLRGLFFSVFFGGSSSSWATTADSSIYFRNFRITT